MGFFQWPVTRGAEITALKCLLVTKETGKGSIKWYMKNKRETWSRKRHFSGEKLKIVGGFLGVQRVDTKRWCCWCINKVEFHICFLVCGWNLFFKKEKKKKKRTKQQNP